MKKDVGFHGWEEQKDYGILKILLYIFQILTMAMYYFLKS